MTVEGFGASIYRVTTLKVLVPEFSSEEKRFMRWLSFSPTCCSNFSILKVIVIMAKDYRK